MDRIIVSVIVTTVSGARFPDFLDLLEALKRQDQDDFELIVIVDENRNHFLNIERSVEGSPFPVKVEFNGNNLGLAHSRNLGMGLAKGDILAFIDDDAEPCDDWVRTIREVLQDQGIGAVTGDIVPKWMEPGMDWFPEELFWMISCSYSITPKERGDIDRGFGVDMAFSRKAIEKAGLFDTRFGITKKRWIGGEDTEMFLRIRSLGYRVVYEPRMRVCHHIPPDRLRLDKLVKRAVAQGRGTVILKRGMKDRGRDHSGRSYILDTMFRFVPNKLRGLVTRDALNSIRDLGVVLTINMFIIVGYGLEIVKPTDG